MKRLFLLLFCLLFLLPIVAFAHHEGNAGLQCWSWINSRAPGAKITFFLTVQKKQDDDTINGVTRYDVHGVRLDPSLRVKPVAGDVIGFSNDVQIWNIFTPVGAWDVASEWDPATEDFGNHHGLWMTDGFDHGGHRSIFRGFKVSGKFSEREQIGTLKRFESGCQWPIEI